MLSSRLVPGWAFALSSVLAAGAAGLESELNQPAWAVLESALQLSSRATSEGTKRVAFGMGGGLEKRCRECALGPVNKPLSISAHIEVPGIRPVNAAVLTQ